MCFSKKNILLRIEKNIKKRGFYLTLGEEYCVKDYFSKFSKFSLIMVNLV